MVRSQRGPSAQMIRFAAASVWPICRPLAPPVLPVFSADNDVPTDDWGPAYAKCADVGGLFELITTALEGGQGEYDRWPKDVTIHGDTIFKSGRLLVHVQAAAVILA